MVKYDDRRLDSVFAALADSTRRGILAELLNGSRSVTELSAAYDLSLPGFLKHLQILEDASLIAREKTGRVVQCSLTADAMQPVGEWLAKYRSFWKLRLDSLDRYLDQEESTWPAARKNLPSKSSGASRR